MNGKYYDKNNVTKKQNYMKLFQMFIRLKTFIETKLKMRSRDHVNELCKLASL